jgi:hypothetical protein
MLSKKAMTWDSGSETLAWPPLVEVVEVECLGLERIGAVRLHDGGEW